jgi:hypothetical protein
MYVPQSAPTQKEDADLRGDNEAIPFLAVLKREFPEFWAWRDPVAMKRMRDELGMGMGAQSTSPDEDARLKQGREEDMNELAGEKSIPAAQSAVPGHRGTRRVGFRGPSKDPIFGDEIGSDKNGILRVARDRRL